MAALQQDSFSSSVHIPIGDQGTRTSQISPSTMQVAGETSTVSSISMSEFIVGNFAKLLFFTHLIAIASLITFLFIRSFTSHNHHDHSSHSLTIVPLLSSIAASTLSSFICLLFAIYRPSKSIKISFWLAPFVSLSAAVLLLCTDPGGSALASASFFLILSLVLSLYACWVSARIHHANKLLEFSIFVTPPSFAIFKLVVVAVGGALFYTGFWLLGVDGIAVHRSSFDPVYVGMLLLSLSWTMHVIRNIVRISVAEFAYASMLQSAVLQEFQHFRVKSFSSVCLGSIMEPMATAVRAVARGMGIVVGDTDEFLFSCTSCMAGVADRVVAGANQWGFVLIGAKGKGFVSASKDAWEMFEKKQGMVGLVDSDLTGSFCFYCGVAAGSVGALVGVAWVIALDNCYAAAGVAMYAFIIGYFLNLIALAWPQACVLACHVAYAENPNNEQLHTVIADQLQEQIQELQP